ncbi:MAG: hypothetical protein M3Z05_03880 [Gemmatimonadota bacterium]|nr:hypothetical protein [Gemmatimonadota bacterium]
MPTLRRFIASTFAAAAIALQGAMAPALACGATTVDMQHQNHAPATHADPGNRNRMTAVESAALSPLAHHHADHAPCPTPIGDGCLAALLWTPPVAAASGNAALHPNGQSRIGTAIVALMSASPRRPVAPPPRV